MKVLIIACFLFLGAAVAAPESDLELGKAAKFLRYTADTFDNLSTRERIETINEFFDMVFTEMGFLIVRIGMDPMALPDNTQNVAGATLTMANGSLADLSQIYRDGDVILMYDDRILTSTIPIKFKRFLLNYDYRLKFFGLSTLGKIRGTVEDVTLYFTITINFKELVVTLNEFVIPEITKLEVKFEGGVIGSIANAVSSVVTTLFKGLIKSTLETLIKSTLEVVIAELNKVLAEIKNPSIIYILPEEKLSLNYN